MFVRLAQEWTGPDKARHRAGDLIEVDHVTLAELEAGGFVATEDEDTGRTEKRDPTAEPADPPPADAQDSDGPDNDGGGSGDSNPDQASWPPVS